jgi:hypothetical protein
MKHLKTLSGNQELLAFAAAIAVIIAGTCTLPDLFWSTMPLFAIASTGLVFIAKKPILMGLLAGMTAIALNAYIIMIGVPYLLFFAFGLFIIVFALAVGAGRRINNYKLSKKK